MSESHRRTGHHCGAGHRESVVDLIARCGEVLTLGHKRQIAPAEAEGVARTRSEQAVVLGALLGQQVPYAGEIGGKLPSAGLKLGLREKFVTRSGHDAGIGVEVGGGRRSWR